MNISKVVINLEPNASLKLEIALPRSVDCVPRAIADRSESSGAEAKRLHHVVGGLGQGHRIVDSQCAKRRGPGQARAD
jgi:hypothetical protein